MEIWLGLITQGLARRLDFKKLSNFKKKNHLNQALCDQVIAL